MANKRMTDFPVETTLDPDNDLFLYVDKSDTSSHPDGTNKATTSNGVVRSGTVSSSTGANQKIGDALDARVNKAGGDASNTVIDSSTGVGQTLSEAIDQRVIYVDTIADLQSLPTSGLVDGQVAAVNGASFKWDSNSSDWKAKTIIPLSIFGTSSQDVERYLDYLDQFDSFTIWFDVDSSVEPPKGGEFKRFSNKKKIRIIQEGTITDAQVYADSEQSDLLVFDTVDSIDFGDEFSVNGSRTSTTQGEDIGCNIVRMQDVLYAKGHIRSIGNRSAFSTTEFSFTQNGTFVGTVYSEFNHYGGTFLMWDYIDAKITAIGAYRSAFVRGCLGGKCHVIGRQQVGATLIKAYPTSNIMQNVFFDLHFRDGNPYSNESFSPVALEYQADNSDPSIVMKNISINMDIDSSTTGFNRYRNLFAINNLSMSGASSSSDKGHVLSGLYFTGVLDITAGPGTSEDPIDFAYLGSLEFNTVKNIVLDRVELVGSNNFGGQLGLPHSLNNCDFGEYKDVSRREATGVISNSNIYAGPLPGSDRLLFKVTRTSKGTGVITYHARNTSSDITDITLGRIAFNCVVTNSGSIAVSRETEVYKNFNGLEAVISIVSQSGTDEAFIGISETNYTGSDAEICVTFEFFPSHPLSLENYYLMGSV